MRVITALPHRVVVRNNVLAFVKCLEQNLIHSKGLISECYLGEKEHARVIAEWESGDHLSCCVSRTPFIRCIRMSQGVRLYGGTNTTGQVSVSVAG